MQNKYLILMFVVMVAFAGFFAHAQIQNTDIILNISPQYPNSNQNVNVTLNSYSVSLDKANITWSVDDQQVSRGIGKKSLSYKMGSSGETLFISILIETIDGQNIQKTLTITPADVDMLWEAYDSYTPPFYKGKALTPSQGKFKVVAIPNVINQGSKVNPNNLSYVWSKDGKVQTASSGWGKNFLIFQNSYLDKGNTVEVKISDISGNTDALGKINLNTVNPKILFYENDPSFGVKWENALNNGFIVDSAGKTIVIEPYFFSPKDLGSSDLTFDWFLNGDKISTPEPKNILSIKPEAGQTGSATIKITIENVKTLFQNMSKQLSVSF